MEPQIIKDGQISSDTIDKTALINLCKQMLKESIKLGNMDDIAQTKFIEKYNTFSVEYPSVFNIIMIEKQFVQPAFIQYIEFRAKQPLVYTNSEQSIKDLCYYPLKLFKFTNKYHSKQQYEQFKTELYAQMSKYHEEQKLQLKQMSQTIIDKQAMIKQELTQQILNLALKHQMNN